MGRRRRWGRCRLRCASLRGCGRRCGELGDVLEVRRESGQEVVFGGGRWGRNGGTVTLLRLLSVGAPAAGEGTQNINRGPRAASILKTRSAVLEHHRTYLRGENGGALCSVSTPKPKSDLKNKMLTPTILIVLCQLKV